MEEIQEKVKEFIKKRAELKEYEPSLEILFVHLSEEVGELAAQIYSKKARPEKYEEEKLKDSVCDVILAAVGIANYLNMDLSKELNNVINELNNRKL